MRKLLQLTGVPALILLCALILALILVPKAAENKAINRALERDATEILTFEEVGYDEARMDRVFRVKVKNSRPTSLPYTFLYISDEDGKDIFCTVRGEFDSLRIGDKYAGIDYIAPESECVLYVWIDDYKLNGLDHIYITDLYSDEEQGRRFDIEVKNYK